MRKIRTIALALAATAVYAGLSVAAVEAASAAPAPATVLMLNGNPTCLASGSTCIRDANNSDTIGNPIVEGSNINGPAENMTFDSFTNLLHFVSHPGRCVGLTQDDTGVILQPCNGGHGILWQELSRGCCGAVAFINNAATQHFGTETDLTAVNFNGAQLSAAAAGQGFQRFK